MEIIIVVVASLSTFMLIYLFIHHCRNTRYYVIIRQQVLEMYLIYIKEMKRVELTPDVRLNKLIKSELSDFEIAFLSYATQRIIKRRCPSERVVLNEIQYNGLIALRDSLEIKTIQNLFLERSEYFKHVYSKVISKEWEEIIHSQHILDLLVHPLRFFLYHLLIE